MSLENVKIPNHIAIILDGNGTWAKKRGLPRTMGHRKGAKNLVNVTKHALELGVKYLTVFAFSTENWNRPKDEVDYLMSLPKELLSEYKGKMVNDEIRFRVIGCEDHLSKEALDEIKKAEEETKNNTKMTLTVAFNYGGKRELTDVCKKIAEKVKNEQMTISDINEDAISDNLYASDLPNVDLLIRTSGQYRISNFMLWQCAYSEFYFPKTLWPDFKGRDLEKAILEYNNRNRRFGGIKE